MDVEQKQCLLKYLKFYPGDVDSQWGQQSQQAAEAFQRQHNLTVDGKIGPLTEKQLKEAVYKDEFAPAPEKAEQPAQEAVVATGGGAVDWAKDSPYFVRAEFRCPCGKCGGFPVEPQRGIVLEANALRKAMGKPVNIVPLSGDPHAGGSGVRCQTYNDSLPGSVPNSRHVKGKAVDFSCPSRSAATIEGWLNKEKAAGRLRYWYKCGSVTYHMDIL